MSKQILAWMLFLVSPLLLAQSPQQSESGAPSRPALKKYSDPKLPAAANKAMDSIDGHRIRAHVKYLSSDLLEGRGTGQRGGDVAAHYIATQLELYGLKPAGDNDTYFQKVPLTVIDTQPQTEFSLLPENGPAMELRYKDDYVVNNETLTPQVTVDAPIVFVGYGIKAPEYQWDDYKGVDVKGKVLLMLVNEPPSDKEDFFKGKALTYYGRWTYKYEQAARMGAVGAILIHNTQMASYGWDVVRTSWTGERSYLRSNQPRLEAAGWIQQEVARKFAAATGQDLDKWFAEAKSRDFHPVPLKARLQTTIYAKTKQVSSDNVVAMLPGSDAQLRSQAVMFTAHYDHLGIHASEPGDNIYNGAVDNGTGTGILLELAHAFATSAVRPKRSIIFAAVTAEEQGLLGSEFLGQHPPIPASNIVLDLNFDALPPRGIPQEVEVTGADRTTFYPVVEQTSRIFGLAIRPDSHPEAGHYYRSDHFSLAKVGVPAFSVSEGMKYEGHTEEWGRRQADEFTANNYHQPSDEFHVDMDFRGDAKMARFGFDLGWKAATMPGRIEWHPGDEFEAARKASRKAD